MLLFRCPVNIEGKYSILWVVIAKQNFIINGKKMKNLTYIFDTLNNVLK